MKTKTQKLNNIIGQINGIKKMIDAEKECISVLTQLKAVRSAVNSVMDEVVEDQFNKCLTKLDKTDRETFTKMKNYVKSN